MVRGTKNNSAKRTQERNRFLLAVDILMIVVVSFNLIWIVFDWSFQSDTFRELVAMVSQPFYEFYRDRVHPDFLFYDVLFISFYLVELGIRWVVSIVKRDYPKWYYFPFVNWYDVLGCIPIGSFRFFRLLRIFALLMRMHRLGFIDITRTFFYDILARYLNIFTEEVTNRVVYNIITDVQDELNEGSPVVETIIDNVIEPRRDALVEWISHRVGLIAGRGYELYREDISRYVERRIGEAVEQNREIRQIAAVPVVGTYISSRLEQAIGDIVLNVINGAITDLASKDNRVIVDDVTRLAVEAFQVEDMDRNLHNIVLDMVNRSLDVIKARVSVQQWKLRPEERVERIRELMRNEFNDAQGQNQPPKTG
jgi:hypothetical protein